MSGRTAANWCRRVVQPYRARSSSAVAAYLDPEGTELLAQGPAGASPDADTIFEIGSITKVFTALLAAKFALDGNLDLDSPVRGLLPDFDMLADTVTVRRLATHTSGLPRIPDGLPDLDKGNPYSRIDRAALRSWFASPSGRRRIGKPGPMVYSNLGAGLLGLALGDLAGDGYKAALQREILGPLGLTSTYSDVPEGEGHRLAQPHGLFSRPVPVWDFDALAGAGTLKSTATDLLQFSRAVIAAPGRDDSLSRAIVMTLATQVPGAKPFIPDTCLGWTRIKEKQSGTGIFAHDGGTAGSSATLFICPELQFALLGLVNKGINLWTMIRLVRSDPAGLLSEICRHRRQY